MEEFFRTYFGGLDTAVIAALGVITATALTQFYTVLGNLAHWGPWKNPLHDVNTDQFMPFIAMLHGTAYGLLIGPAPGCTDNIRSAVVYGGATVIMYFIVKKLLAPFTPARTGGTP